jgi:hypothetical protein
MQWAMNCCCLSWVKEKCRNDFLAHTAANMHIVRGSAKCIRATMPRAQRSFLMHRRCGTPGLSGLLTPIAAMEWTSRASLHRFDCLPKCNVFLGPGAGPIIPVWLSLRRSAAGAMLPNVLQHPPEAGVRRKSVSGVPASSSLTMRGRRRVLVPKPNALAITSSTFQNSQPVKRTSICKAAPSSRAVCSTLRRAARTQCTSASFLTP